MYIQNCANAIASAHALSRVDVNVISTCKREVSARKQANLNDIVHNSLAKCNLRILSLDAFNQMQKDATVEAANLAGIRNVALMQEPVAAVMSVMKEDSLLG